MKEYPNPLPSGLVRSHGDPEWGWTGAFLYVFTRKKRASIVVSQGGGWEHVSVRIQKRNERGKVQGFTPTWEDMAFFKDLFWEPEEAVMQLHPPQSQYVNNHPHVLHLWAPLGAQIPLPPKEFV